jgi:hypothetical protein
VPEGHAEQRSALSALALAVGHLGLLERVVRVQARDAVQLRAELARELERRLRELEAGEFPAREAVGRLGEGQIQRLHLGFRNSR